MIKRTFFSFSVLGLAVHGVAWACSCAMITSSPEELFQDNNVVFYGEVLSVVEPISLGCSGVQSSADPIDVQFEVIEGYKGADDGETLKFTTARGGASCGVAFEEGETWLIYTSSDNLNLCDPSVRVEDDDADLDVLREL